MRVVRESADGGQLTASEAIQRLLDAQISLRNNRRLQAAMRSSRLPAVKTLESFVRCSAMKSWRQRSSIAYCITATW